VRRNAGQHAENDQGERSHFQCRRKTLLPEKAVQQRKQSFEEDHLAYQGQRQELAHAVPQTIADDGRQHRDADRDAGKVEPCGTVMKARAQGESNRNKHQGLHARDEPRQQIPVLSRHVAQSAKTTAVCDGVARPGYQCADGAEQAYERRAARNRGCHGLPADADRAGRAEKQRRHKPA